MSTKYTSLSGIERIETTGYDIDISGGSSLGDLLNQIIYIVIAVAIILAIFMIIRAGYEYMTSSDNADKKGRSKRRLQAAFGGLLLALGTVLILRTINPELVELEFKFPALEVPEVTRTPTLEDKYEAAINDGLDETDLVWFTADLVMISNESSHSNDELVELIKEQAESDSGYESYYNFLNQIFQEKLNLERELSGDRSTNGSTDYYNEIARKEKLLKKYNSLINRLNIINNSPNMSPAGQQIWSDRYNEYLSLTGINQQYEKTEKIDPSSVTTGADIINYFNQQNTD